MNCPQCGASIAGNQCSYCGFTAAGPGGAPGGAPYGGPPMGGMGQPTARDAEYQAAMGQPMANSPEYRAAMGQPTANSPEYQAAMGQPGSHMGPYNPPIGGGPYGQSPMMAPGSTTMAKKGCCGCLSVMMLACTAAGVCSLVWILV